MSDGYRDADRRRQAGIPSEYRQAKLFPIPPDGRPAETVLLTTGGQTWDKDELVSLGLSPTSSTPTSSTPTMSMPGFAIRLSVVLAELQRLLERKHQTYGNDNLKRHGEQGVVVRLDDKLARLNTLLSKPSEAESLRETIEDTWFDIAGYAMMAIMLRRGKL